MVFDVYLMKAFFYVCLFSGIPLIVSSISGLLVSVVQAATQVQEQSLSFLIKFITVSGVLALFGNYFLSEMVQFIQELFSSLAVLGKV